MCGSLAPDPFTDRVSQAATIFVYAGVIVLFICNMFWAQRVVRAQHPHFGWSKPFSLWLPILMGIMVVTIFALIVAVCCQFYVLGAQGWTHDVQLYGAFLYGFTAILPIPIVIISALARKLPSRRGTPVDNFGQVGSIRSKIMIILISAVFLSAGAWYRAVTEVLPEAAINAPMPWYFGKVYFYVFDFTIEICVVLVWLAIRIDRRFIVPDGAKGPYSYGNGFVFAGEDGHQKVHEGAPGTTPSQRHLMSVYSVPDTDDLSRPMSIYSRVSVAAPSLLREVPISLSRAQSWENLRAHMSGEFSEEFSKSKLSLSKDSAYYSRPGSYEMQASPRAPPGELAYDDKSGRWSVAPPSFSFSTPRPASYEIRHSMNDSPRPRTATTEQPVPDVPRGRNSDVVARAVSVETPRPGSEPRPTSLASQETAPRPQSARRFSSRTDGTRSDVSSLRYVDAVQNADDLRPVSRDEEGVSRPYEISAKKIGVALSQEH